MSDKIDTKEPAKFLGIRLSAWLEIFLFFLIMYLLDLFFGNHDSFFFVCPHPFWIIIILVAAQYGTNAALLATVVATILLLIGYHPQRTILQDQFEYFFLLAKKPILWFIAAVILGEIRMRHIRERDKLKKIALEAEEKEQTITTAYNQLKDQKEAIEVRFASEMQTALMAYQSFRLLEGKGKEEIIRGALEMIRTLLGAQKFSVFAKKDHKISRIAFEGWEEKDPFATTFASDTSLYKEVIGKQHVLTVLKDHDRQVLGNEGMIAAPIWDKDTQQIYGMLKVEEIPFIQMKLPAIESLRMIGEWVGAAYGSYLEKESAHENQFLDPKSEMFTHKFFDYQKTFLVNTGKRLKLDVTLLSISLVEEEKLKEYKREDILHSFRRIVAQHLRNTDQPFEFEEHEGIGFTLVLLNVSAKDGEIVRQKIAEALEHEFKKKLTFNYQVTPLYEKE